MKRALIAIVVLVLAVLGVAVFLLLRNLDTLVAAAIEKYGSEATGTAVRVEGVEIALREGRVAVRGLSVGNPKGFEADHALSWKEVEVDIDPKSVTSPPYVLESVVVRAPEVVFELNAAGQSNLKQLQDRLQSRGGGEKPSGGESGGGDATQPRLRVASFVFERGAIEARTRAVGGEDLRVEMPPLRLQNLGGADGATASEIARSVLLVYTEQVLSAVAQRELGTRAERLIDKNLEGEQAEAAKKLLKGVLGR